MKAIITQFDLQTRLFKNVTTEVNDSDAQTQMNGNTNHMAWLTGHTVSARYTLANVLGITDQEPYPHLFAQGKGIDSDTTYPSMDDLRKDWDTISEKIRAVLEGLDEAALNQKAPFPVPTGDTIGQFVPFMMHHEAYTIGQMGIVRRFHGLDAMKYN